MRILDDLGYIRVDAMGALASTIAISACEVKEPGFALSPSILEGRFCAVLEILPVVVGGTDGGWEGVIYTRWLSNAKFHHHVTTTVGVFASLVHGMVHLKVVPSSSA